MSVHDSALDPVALAFARTLLRPPVKRDRTWPALAASAFAAVAALALAAVVITAPPMMSGDPPPKVKAGLAR